MQAKDWPSKRELSALRSAACHVLRVGAPLDGSGRTRPATPESLGFTVNGLGGLVLWLGFGTRQRGPSPGSPFLPPLAVSHDFFAAAEHGQTYNVNRTSAVILSIHECHDQRCHGQPLRECHYRLCHGQPHPSRLVHRGHYAIYSIA